MAKLGDKEALAQLCQDFAPLVEASAKRYVGWKNAWEDLMQIGYEQLVQGILSFDSNRGVFLSHYLKRLVQGSIWSAVRRREKERTRVAKGVPGGDEEDRELSVELLADETMAGLFLEVEWEELFTTLSPREKIAIRYTVLMDYRDREVAAAYGVSKDTVKTWRKRGIAKLRKAYASLTL